MNPLVYQIDRFNSDLLDYDSTELYQILPGPTLIHLQGRRDPPLFVSVLLHGNEIAGWETIRSILRKETISELPRSLSIFIGNVAAARHGVRHLEYQLDYNRIWCGGTHPEHAIAQEVLNEMRRRRVFASIDIHNNTGMNPHYACVNVIDDRFLSLAGGFSSKIVYFLRPETVLSRAFAALCPSVTLECGRPGETDGVDHAARFVEYALRLDAIPRAVPAHLQLFHTVATVKIAPGVSFGFTDEQADLVLEAALEKHNFTLVEAGTVFARSNSSRAPFDVRDEVGKDVFTTYFSQSGGLIVTRRSFVLSMFTRDERIIAQDCLCYLMEYYGQRTEDG